MWKNSAQVLLGNFDLFTARSTFGYVHGSIVQWMRKCVLGADDCYFAVFSIVFETYTLLEQVISLNKTSGHIGNRDYLTKELKDCPLCVLNISNPFFQQRGRRLLYVVFL